MKLTYAIVAASLVVALMPAQGMKYGVSCTTEDNTNADGDYVQCKTVQVPASVNVKPLFRVGSTVCTGLDLGSANIFPCYPDGSTSLAAAIFSNAGFGAAGNRLVSVWAEWVTGIFVSGFSMHVCDDRDLDGICSGMTGESDSTGKWVSADQIRHAYSNQAQFASAPCSDDKKNKDDKNCDFDPTDAEVAEFCMMPAVPPAPAPWNDGQVVVFIGNWVSVDPFDPNIGHGISTDTYDVWMKVHRNWDNTDYVACTPPDCDDGIDNDDDGTVDSDDLQCNNHDDHSELPECSDGIDNNDEDTLADYSATPGFGDPDCTSAADNNEKSFLEWI